MKKSQTWQVIAIVCIALLALFVDLNIQHPEWFKSLLFWRPKGQREIALQLGLDLQGGLQVLLSADVPEGQELAPASMETARRIVENRVNSLGLTEPVVQAQGERRIIVELPGVENPEQAVETIKSTALLEFVDAGPTPLLPGTVITTSLGPPDFALSPSEAGLDPGASDALTVTEAVSPTETTPPTLPGAQPSRVYETVITGAGIQNVGLNRSQQNEFMIPFELNDQAAQEFAVYTANNEGQFLCIVLDKTVISCPTIREPIPNGQASISGAFTLEEAQQLAIQLRYGALPVPLRVESFNRIGASLGQESVEKSVRAGAIGLIIVLFFMLVYYRLPGGLADLALIIYVLLNFAIYKLAPITLTLPGIAGFILSAGMAVDANILIFERMKEELRRGRALSSAITIGFNRAWPSIRDGQLSTLIICAILFLFGTNFGASIVKGFAMTLAIGTVVNVFTAVFATRTFIQVIANAAGRELAEREWLLGV
jgi:protein-export membrane protein SecD